MMARFSTEPSWMAAAQPMPLDQAKALLSSDKRDVRIEVLVDFLAVSLDLDEAAKEKQEKTK